MDMMEKMLLINPWSGKKKLYEFLVTEIQGYIKFKLLCLTLKTEAVLAFAELFEAHNNYDIWSITSYNDTEAADVILWSNNFNRNQNCF